MANFKIKVRKIQAATVVRSALYEVEYAPGVSTNVFASDRAEALSRLGF